MKALHAHPQFDDEIERASIALFLRLNYIPAPYTIYRVFRKLAPGTILAIAGAGDRGRSRPYWSAREIAERGVRNPFVGTDEEAVDELQRLLLESIHLRMIADVLGVFPSGGIDAPRDGANAGANHAAGKDVHDRFQRERIQRSSARRRKSRVTFWDFCVAREKK